MLNVYFNLFQLIVKVCLQIFLLVLEHVNMALECLVLILKLDDILL